MEGEQMALRIAGKTAQYTAPSVSFEASHEDLLSAAEGLGTELKQVRDMLEDIQDRVERARAEASKSCGAG